MRVLKRLPRSFRGLTVFGLLAVAGVACATTPDLRDASGVVVTTGAESVFDLRVGDCAAPLEMWPEALLEADMAEVLLTPCDAPHDWQVYGIVSHPDGPYPGAAAVATFADAQCLALLDSGNVTDNVTFSYLLPTETGWHENADRTIICIDIK